MLCCFSQCADKVCSYVHRLRRANQHPMHVRRRVLLEREGTKGRRAYDISQAVLYMCSTQQLIITAETNRTQLSMATCSRSAFCRCWQLYFHLLNVFIAIPHFFESEDCTDLIQWVHAIAIVDKHQDLGMRYSQFTQHSTHMPTLWLTCQEFCGKWNTTLL